MQNAILKYGDLEVTCHSFSIQDKEEIEVRYEDENIWLTQKMLSTLYNVEINTINYHIKKIYNDNIHYHK